MHTSRWLAERGAHVILAGRNPERLEACANKIREVATKADGTKNEAVLITPIELDMSSLKSVETFVEKFQALNLPLNVLINNAGVMGTPYSKTADGFELQFGTNHVSVFVTPTRTRERSNMREQATKLI